MITLATGLSNVRKLDSPSCCTSSHRRASQHASHDQATIRVERFRLCVSVFSRSTSILAEPTVALTHFWQYQVMLSSLSSLHVLHCSSLQTLRMFATMDGVKAASYIYSAAGLYGASILLPQLFLEKTVSEKVAPIPRDSAQYFYGMYGAALAFQGVFLVMGRDPVRYRALIPFAVAEKLIFAGACAMLHGQKRLPEGMRLGALIDAVLGVAFIGTWFLTDGKAN